MKLPLWLEGDVGKLLLIGIFAAALYVSVIVLSLFINTEWYKVLAGISVGHLLFGRAAGLSVAFAMGASAEAGIIINFALEAVMVMIIYPLFILSWNQLLRTPRLKRWVDRARNDAKRYQDKIQRYGMIGLFIFVWFPFWMTGPVIGAVIGYLMGLRHRNTLFIVLSGTLLATICWAIFLERLQAWMRTLDPMAPWYLVTGFIAIATAFYIKKRFY